MNLKLWSDAEFATDGVQKITRAGRMAAPRLGHGAPTGHDGKTEMILVANSLVALTALLHLGFLYLEMFAWTRTAGLRAFRQTAERAEATRVLAANQGLYNGFLAAGLFWGVVQPDPLFAFQIKLFFLACVLVAAAFGAMTVSRRILVIQGGPALLALIAVLAGA